MSATRLFEDKPAVRERVPLLIGLTGASSSGKTMSALRLATGIQKVAKGPIWYIDTEARRSLHYADRYSFTFVEFKAPFGPLDYLAAIEHCAKKGAQTIVVDSMSHEHEGPGGVLEMHEAETTRIAKEWGLPRDKANMSGWQKPKSERKRLLNTILQMPINFIFCFRAKDKMDLTGKKPAHTGWVPIAGEEFVYEMTIQFLLYPGADGVPTWQSEETGERAIIKCPTQFRGIFTKQHALCEEDGEAMAKWAAGGESLPAPVPPTDEECDAVVTEIEAARSEDVRAIAAREKSRPWTQFQRDRIRRAIESVSAQR